MCLASRPGRASHLPRRGRDARRVLKRDLTHAAESAPARGIHPRPLSYMPPQDARMGKVPTLSTLVTLSLPPDAQNETAVINITGIAVNSATAGYKCERHLCCAVLLLRCAVSFRFSGCAGANWRPAGRRRHDAIACAHVRDHIYVQQEASVHGRRCHQAWRSIRTNLIRSPRHS